MTTYLTEEEQIQQLKQWLKQYGVSIVAGLLLAGLFLFGWNYWQKYHTKQLLHASAIYDEMLTLRAQNNEPSVAIQAHKLISHYPKTPYATMAALTLARSAVMHHQYDEAITQLHWVTRHTSDQAIRMIAEIRLARILITQQKPDDALSLLSKIKDKAFIGLADEVRGDAYLVKNDKLSAQKAYHAALQELPNAEITRPMLDIKLANIATTGSSSLAQ